MAMIALLCKKFRLWPVSQRWNVNFVNEEYFRQIHQLSTHPAARFGTPDGPLDFRVQIPYFLYKSKTTVKAMAST
jgi:hypothetical protein